MFSYISRFKFTIALTAIALGLFLYWPKESLLTGDIFGTYYRIVLYHPKWVSKEKLDSEIQNIFLEINQVFSTYDDSSLISRYNLEKKDARILLPQSFSDVFKFGDLLYKQTGGAWDASAYPLFNIWKSESSKINFPQKETVQKAMLQIGYSKIIWEQERGLRKAFSEQALDYSSIVKGYAVDQLFEFLVEQGIKSAFIEIGGEVRVLGKKPNKDLWRIGIQDPSNESELFARIQLASGAMATSGDYQQFFEYQGKQYSHIINPKTGYPIVKKIASVSIIAPTCMKADGYATALMLMDIDKGLALIESLRGIEALVLQYDENKSFKSHYTSGFKNYLMNP